MRLVQMMVDSWSGNARNSTD